MGSLAIAFTAVLALMWASSLTLSSPPINHGDLSTLVGHLRGIGISDACIASALDTCVSTSQDSQSTPRLPPTNSSPVLRILFDLGYSDACVAQHLDECAGASQEDPTQTLLKEARGVLQETRDLLLAVVPSVSKLLNARHCKDLLNAGDTESGVRVIHPPYLDPTQPQRHLTVYCDQTTDGGGWTVFQRRTNATVRENFYRQWSAYKEGFGNLEEEFWLGLDALHALTSTEPQELRINLADWEGEHRHAQYSSFRVDGPSAKYRLTVEGYSGTAGDCFTRHSGQKFTTHDSDNDSWSRNCAVMYRGGWWYRACHGSNLNGYQYEHNPSEHGKGINWHLWRDNKYSLRGTTMMVRPKIGG